MIPSSTAPKQYKLDAALPGQTQVTPLRQVVEAAVNKTEKDSQTRVLYLKSTAATPDQPAQRYMTTKFDSRHEDPSVRGSAQSLKIARTQRQNGTQQLKFLAEQMRNLPKLPKQPRKVAPTAQAVIQLCDEAPLFGLPCTRELLLQLKEMESAQQTQRSTESTPRQPADTPRSDSEKSQPRQQANGEESSTGSQTHVSKSEKSEKSEDSSPPTTGDTPRKPRPRPGPSKLVRQPGKKADQQNLEQVRKANIERERRQREKKAALEIRNLMFPKQSPVQSPRTPRNPPPVAIPSPLPSSASAPLLPTSVPTEVPARDTSLNALQLPLLPVARKEPMGTESSDEPSPPAAQSDRPKSSNEPLGNDLGASKSHSTPASPTQANPEPPTSPRKDPLKKQPKPRPNLKQPAAQSATPRSRPADSLSADSPSADTSSPPTEMKPEDWFNEL